MAIKTELDLGALGPLLAPLDLRPRRLRGLEEGTVNSNFRVETDGGPVFVRINEGKSETDVCYEAALLWHLGLRRFPTPQPLRRVDGVPFLLYQGKPVTVFPWIGGRHVADGDIGRSHAIQVGQVLGELHRAAASFGRRRDGIYTFAHIMKRVDGMRGEPRVAEVLPSLEEEIAYLAQTRTKALPTGTIHGDLFPDNVLWRHGKVAAVLDFEQASLGSLVYDLAVTLLAWCWNGADIDDARAQGMVLGYERVRPLERVEREALFDEARAAALRFTVTRLTDVFLPALPGAERLGKDYRDYLGRLERLRTSLPGRVHAWFAASPPS